MYSLTLPFTLVLDWGGWSKPSYHQEKASVPILQEARWALGLVWMGVENLATTGA
jgi:hypothetical protein